MSSGPNEMPTLDHFILLSGSIHWARLISCLSFFPYVLEVMDMLPPKTTLISAYAHHRQDPLNGVRPDGDLEVPTLLVVASSCDPEKSCTPRDLVLRCDGSRTSF
jgi:hypothetical protein